MIFYWILNGVLLAAASTLYYRSCQGEYRATYWPGLIVKWLGGIAVGALYIYYYPPADTFYFYDLSVKLTDACREDFSKLYSFLVLGDEVASVPTTEPRSRFFVSFLAILNFISGKSYWIDSLWLSFISFAGAWYLVRRLIKLYPDAHLVASLAFLFFPSVVIWGGGVLKESLALASLFVLAGFLLDQVKNHKQNWADYLLLVVASLVLLNLKYYWAAVFFPSAFASVILARWKAASNWSVSRLAFTWIAVFVLLCLLASRLHPNFYFQYFLGVVKENHDAFIRFAPDSLHIKYYNLQAAWWSLLMNSPWALVSGVFRPFLFEARNVLHVVSGLENLFILVLFLFQMSRLKWPPPEDRLLFLAALVFCLVLCNFLALSTPNFGTLSRYRIGFLPILLFVLMMNSERLRGRSFRKIINRVRHPGS